MYRLPNVRTPEHAVKLATFAVAAVLGLGALAPAQASSPTSQDASAVASMVSQYRAAHGLGPLLFLRPHVGQQRWRALLRQAHANGVAAHERLPPMYAYWEELLPRPLSEVRDELGIVPFEEDTSDWLSKSWLGRSAATGFGAYAREAEQAQLARRVVEAGVPFRDLMRASPESAASLRQLVASGADDAAIRIAATRLLSASA